MKVVKHTAGHIFVHLALFTACALLIPVVSAAVDSKENVWLSSPAIVTASALLIIVCVFLMYRIKESIYGMMQSIGAMIFLPGALNVVFSVFNINDFLASGNGITGMAVMKPVAEFYIHHSVPTILSVAAVYMAIGGALYWTGHMWEKVKDKVSILPNNN